MDLFEYQGKRYFAQFGIPVSKGDIADTVDDAVALAERLGYPVTIKAQVQVGGRGKLGGIKLAFNVDEARTHATSILGLDIKGHIVHRLWIEQSSDITREYYASFTLDRAEKSHLCMLSAMGGVDIEQVSEENPEAIARLHINPLDGVNAQDLAKLVDDAGIDEEAKAGVVEILEKLYTCYIDGDADLAEINPLILTPAGKVHALDAKVTLDDDASFRHPEWEEFALSQEGDAREVLAREKGLNYVGLEGSVGIIANGAGLAMSTLDVVNQVGGSAANFLDCGGGADADLLADALEVINSDLQVRAILINIFGGIVRCDEVAKGVLIAIDRVGLTTPIVIRLDGTNAPLAREILAPHLSDRIIMEETMIGAARRAAQIANEGSK